MWSLGDDSVRSYVTIIVVVRALSSIKSTATQSAVDIGQKVHFQFKRVTSGFQKKQERWYFSL